MNSCATHSAPRGDLCFRWDDCAQPGDKLVDRRVIPVGEPPVAWDEVWAGRATIAPVPRLSTYRALSSTGLPPRNSGPDLRERRFSTVSTAPMTTSLRQGLVMTQAVRGQWEPA